MPETKTVEIFMETEFYLFNVMTVRVEPMGAIYSGGPITKEEGATMKVDGLGFIAWDGLLVDADTVKSVSFTCENVIPEVVITMKKVA